MHKKKICIRIPIVTTFETIVYDALRILQIMKMNVGIYSYEYAFFIGFDSIHWNTYAYLNMCILRKSSTSDKSKLLLCIDLGTIL